MTALLFRLKDGEGEAARRLWEAYYGRRVDLAQARLRGAPRGIADEEDVALSAFDNFCRAAGAGRFPLGRPRRPGAGVARAHQPQGRVGALPAASNSWTALPQLPLLPKKREVRD